MRTDGEHSILFKNPDLLLDIEVGWLMGLFPWGGVAVCCVGGEGGLWLRLARASSIPFPPPGRMARVLLPAQPWSSLGHVIELPPMNGQKSHRPVLCLVLKRSHIALHCLLPSVPSGRKHRSLR